MYARNPDTKVVINMDDSYYKSIQTRRKDRLKAEELERNVDNLKGELIEIKNLLTQILDGKNYG